MSWHFLLLGFTLIIVMGCEAKNVKNESSTKAYERFIPPLPEKLKPYGVPTLIKNNLKSFAGFVKGKDSSNMFFWFMPSETNETAPLIIWLQGDPGISSVRAVFENNGPFSVKAQKGLKLRKHYWSKHYNVLYLDTTLGTGYSHAGSTVTYPKNLEDAVANLFDTLTSFFNLFDHFKVNDLYLSGEGFACSFITKLAKRIDSNNRATRSPINLKGLIIENGFCDPIAALDLSNYYERIGLINRYYHSVIYNKEQEIISLIKSNKMEEAFDEYDKYIKGLLTPYKTLFNNYTFYESTNNLIHDKDSRQFGSYEDYIKKPMIKEYLNVDSTLEFSDGKEVLKILRKDLMKSPKDELGQLVSKYSVLLYFGQENPEISPSGAMRLASTLNWCGKAFFETVNYSPWYVNKNLAGHVVDVRAGDCKGVLSWALVRNAGKDVANEKPEEVIDLINKFIANSLPK